MRKVLVTGGSGYIGSHTCLELLESGYEVVVLDNLSNSSDQSLKNVEKLTGKAVTFYQGDICDGRFLDSIFEKEKIDAVIHFAALKAVGESVVRPLDYYETNISGTLALLQVMKKHECKNLIFSSSATVYGHPKTNPIKEDASVSATNPYGQTKLMAERILEDVYLSDQSWNIILLRYFNPIGAHPSGELGESPQSVPNNLLPYITQVAIGQLPFIKVFGQDYPTKDGTGVRDYIHVVDLARGHLAALDHLEKNEGLEVYNLGTGQGYSVLDLINIMSDVVGRAIPYQIEGRRPGDIATCFADPTKAKDKLGWEATFTIVDMCQDAWRWQENYPNGFNE
ncbi:UDP-glucose 4-epimerase GalE [Streptococcus sp. SGI.013]|uniref:UDP-glucose 4-epimerase n=1 Tax=Streptococcus porcorum TaxID=701526 RepID=A0ABV2JGJ3_9STRE